MCADTADLTYEALLADPLIQMVMQSDGVTQAQLVAVLREAAYAVQARAELLPMRPRPTLVYSAAPLPSSAPADAPMKIRATGT